MKLVFLKNIFRRISQGQIGVPQLQFVLNMFSRTIETTKGGFLPIFFKGRLEDF